MVENVLRGIVNHGIDLSRMIKTDGTDLFSTYATAPKGRMPHLQDSVVDAFGRVLDIFERPYNLRKPEFDVTGLKPSRQVDLAESQKDKEVEIKPPPRPHVNEDIHVNYLADFTRAQYNAIHKPVTKDEDGIPLMPAVERKIMGMSASPCEAETRLCSECYISLATVRCYNCATHFCAVCAIQQHSEGIYTSHKLVTSTSGKEAKLNVTDALEGKLSYGELAAGPTGSHVGNLSKDLTIQIRQGEAAYPTYESCTVHVGNALRFACVKCHLLPVCEVCSTEAHAGSDHKIVEIETAVAEVKELLAECLSSVVRRHNDLSLFLPELKQLSHTSNVGLKNATRSVRSGIQRCVDALKLKKTLGLQEIENMQRIGSAALNRMMHASGTLNKYLKGCITQLEAINGMTNAGMALNMFVDLRSIYEKLLFTDEEIPDLILEIPHWKLHSGNIPNLLAEKETRIHAGMAKIAGLATHLRTKVQDSVSNIEKVSGGAFLPEDRRMLDKPYRHADRRTRGVGPALNIPGAENTLDMITHSQLKGMFLRRDSQRCAWRQRAVYLCGHRLFVLDSDFYAEDAPIESSIDLTAVTIRSFDDEEVLPVTKLQRMGHPHGFEVTEHSGRAMRYWLFTCESRNTVMLWITKISHEIKRIQRDREMALLTKEQKEKMGAVPLQETEAAATLQALHKPNCEPKVSGFVADPAGEHKTCDETHEDDCIYDELNFQAVMESLKKFKDESNSLYNKCFPGDKKVDAGPWVVERVTNHAAGIPHSMSATSGETPITDRSQSSRFVRGESISAGRYAMPEVVSQRSNSITPRDTVFSARQVKIPDSLPEFKYAPEVKSPRTIHKMFSDLARRARKEKECDILDQY
ncbi:hypothetical protein BgAZ_501550 [Babesia gibsoni]|uniref:PH domain-containing protein n=1 Tax=Babesia gibsoni TaxID=33632 RepID=A0AAD8LI51_BABGI|nr:hypothetical protein BgAZ_501550 [Babesia gibsoni]